MYDRVIGQKDTPKIRLHEGKIGCKSRVNGFQYKKEKKK